MSQNNRISINIPDAVLLDAKKNIENATTALKPFLQGLSADERKSLPKMRDKTIAFVDKADSYANSNAEFAPNFLDIAEMGFDLQAEKN